MDCEHYWVGVRPLAVNIMCPQCDGSWVVDPEECNFQGLKVH